LSQIFSARDVQYSQSKFKQHLYSAVHSLIPEDGDVDAAQNSSLSNIMQQKNGPTEKLFIH